MAIFFEGFLTTSVIRYFTHIQKKEQKIGEILFYSKKNPIYHSRGQGSEVEFLKVKYIFRGEERTKKF